MQIFRYAEQGSIKLLWISATNPAVSMPDLARIRRILADEELFVVVQDLFLTETAELADVVLPAATWGEKHRHVHQRRPHRAPLRAGGRPARRGAQRPRHLPRLRHGGWTSATATASRSITWDDPESAFEAWKACSRGRPCDYSGITYELLRGASGIQWPCTDEHPHGTERLYIDGRFNTDPDYCETYGYDLAHRALRARRDRVPGHATRRDGRSCTASSTSPARRRPTTSTRSLLTTGRTVYQFHTRTKTGRAPQLEPPRPMSWVEISRRTMRPRWPSPRATWCASSRRAGLCRGHRPGVTGIRPGVVFVPFHYGDLDDRSMTIRHRAPLERRTS